MNLTRRAASKSGVKKPSLKASVGVYRWRVHILIFLDSTLNPLWLNRGVRRDENPAMRREFDILSVIFL